MKALCYSDWDVMKLGEWPDPTPGPSEVILDVAACGICGSELEAFRHHSPRRTPPLVLGHEFCGVVSELGAEVDGLAIGDRVVASSLVTCDTCVRCQRGDVHLCDNREIFGMNRLGAFGERVNVPVKSVLPWPDQLSAQAACLAEPLGNGVHVRNLTSDLVRDTVVVIGAGPIGLFCQQMQQLDGAKTIVSDMQPGRLEIAKRLGATRVVNAANEDVVQVALEMTDGEGVDLVIDAVGFAATKKQSIEATRPGGAMVWIGISEDPIELSSYAVTLRERRIMGTYALKHSELGEAIDLMASGKIDAESWTNLYALNEAEMAFTDALNPAGDHMKSVIVANG